MKYILTIITIAIITTVSSADTTAVDTSAIEVRQYQLTLRLDMSYLPVNSIEFDNLNSTYEVYDNIYYRFGAEYAVSDLVTAGPSIEYMNRHIEPISTLGLDITAFNFLVDFKLNHKFTDSGKTKMIFGFGTGLASLSEEGGESQTGVIFYVSTGFDIALWKNIGLDMIYRYQFSHLKIEYSNYKYDGSALQFGLNYGLNL